MLLQPLDAKDPAVLVNLNPWIAISFCHAALLEEGCRSGLAVPYSIISLEALRQPRNPRLTASCAGAKGVAAVALRRSPPATSISSGILWENTAAEVPS